MTTAAQEIHAIAEAIAPTWERRRAEDGSGRGTGPGMDAAKARRATGDIVLELAAGVGDTGFDAADIVGERGRLISTDFSPAMLAAAGRRAAARGIANAEFREIDAEQIELDDDSVDGVLCRFGYMLMPDPARRSRRRGVSCARAAGGAGGLGRAGTQPVLRDRRREHVPPRPPATGGSSRPTGLQHGERRAHRRAARGGRVLRSRDRGGPRHVHVPDADDYLSLVADTSGPLGLALGRLSDDRPRDGQGDARGRARALRLAQGYALPGVALGAAAAERGTRR